MAYNLLSCDREQSYLMPPPMRAWLREEGLAWFVVDAVQQMYLREFYAAYRNDGWGAAAYNPAMMVAVPLYAYCQGLRSSRGIGLALERDVGFRVMAATSARPAASSQPETAGAACTRRSGQETEPTHSIAISGPSQ